MAARRLRRRVNSRARSALVRGMCSCAHRFLVGGFLAAVADLSGTGSEFERFLLPFGSLTIITVRTSEFSTLGSAKDGAPQITVVSDSSDGVISSSLPLWEA